MKKFLSLILVLMLAITGVVFAGCGEVNSIKLEGGPSLEEDVYGNGSFVVRKGDYVYYASGFVSKNDLGSAGLTNNLGEVKNGAIYRAKVEETQIEVEDSKAENGKRIESSLVLKNKEMLVSKLAGFENSGLYIFGNKLFFATPSTAKNFDGASLYSIPVFYCVDLDGQNLTQLYVAENFDKGSFSFVAIDGNVYLIVFDGKDITKVDLDGKSTKLASDALTAVLPASMNVKNNEYNAQNFEKFVYFTTKSEKTTDTKDFGTLLKKVDIISGEVTTLIEKDYISVSLVKLDGSKLFYTRNEIKSGSSVTDNYLYCSDLTSDSFVEERLSYQSSITNIIRVELESKSGYVYLNNNKLLFKDDEGNIKSLTSNASTLLFVKDNFVYYIYSSALYRLDLTAESPSEVKLSDKSKIDKTYVDECDGLVFFYVKNSNVYETNYIDVKNFISGTTKPVKAA